MSSRTRAELIEQAVSLGFDPEELARLPSYVIAKKVGDVKPVELVQTDTAESVIDMPTYSNLGDKNFARLEFLIETQKSLKRAVEDNTAALNGCVSEWEADDILVLRKEIDSSQTHLRLMEPEIQELKVWFAGQRHQKLEFYKSVAPKLVDVTGGLDKHFRPKMMRIDQQLQALKLER
jgi:hypothetical protein